MAEAGKLLPDVDWCQDAYHAPRGGRAVVILTEWNEFRGLDLEARKQVMRQPLIVDLRNIFDPEECAAGLRLCRVGRPQPRD